MCWKSDCEPKRQIRQAKTRRMQMMFGCSGGMPMELEHSRE